MPSKVYINISKIIEQESKTSTYKFALLRGTIDLILENSFKKNIGGRVHIPMGLLINKWIFYYYPLLESNVAIPQIHGQKGIAFAPELSTLIRYYQKRGGKSVLYKDIRSSIINKESAELITQLYKKLQKTISTMPMKYLGTSVNQSEYSIYKYHPPGRGSQNEVQFDQITAYGEFSIPSEYFDAFRVLGCFINGQDSIIAKWADFSWNSIKNRVKNKSMIISRLTDSPITERQVNESKTYFRKILQNSDNIKCVWSGKNIIRSAKYDLDHVLPFSVWRNNDLWNLLPTIPSINKEKKDRIPSPYRLNEASSRIFSYWDILYSANEVRFTREIEQALLGQRMSNDWKEKAINRLKDHSEYLIKYRGYEQW
jgi:hypothetical protein